jgi:hypothetical protein
VVKDVLVGKELERASRQLDVKVQELLMED